MALFCSFLWLSNIPMYVMCLCVCICHIFFIYSSVDGHLGCFCVLTIVNSATVNIRAHVSLQISFVWMYAQELEEQWHPTPVLFAWKILWMGEPGRLQSMGSLRVKHDWATSLSLFTFMHWRRKWQPTPVFLPGESQGRGSLGGCHLWGHTESDTTEVT